MALKLLGDLSFKRQVGSSRPSPDPVYGIYRMRETWIGKESDLTAWLLSKPFGGVHETWNWMKLGEVSEPRSLGAGMIEVDLSYAGAPGDTGYTQVPSNSTRSLEQSGKLIGTGRVRYRLWYETQTINTIGQYTDSIYDFPMEAPANRQATVYAPSLTLRYGSLGPKQQPVYKPLALILLANSASSILSLSINKDEKWRVSDGTYPSYALAAAKLLGWSEGGDASLILFANGSINQTGFEPDSPGSGDPVLLTNLNGNPIGKSGWYEYEETWELNTDVILT
jgi:hypothetical protein